MHSAPCYRLFRAAAVTAGRLAAAPASPSFSSSSSLAAASAAPVRTEVRADGAVGTVVLDNAARRNALSLETLRQLEAALLRLAESPGLRAVVLKAAGGPVFSSGHDLRELRARPDTRQAVMAQCSRLMLRIHDLPLPVIAQVSGLATAAGCQLVASCDLAVAGLSARFATPGVKVGLFCSTPAVALARAVPAKTAMRMLLTGEPIGAEAALACGLVSHVAPDDQLEAATDELVAMVTRHSRSVVALGKRVFYQQSQLASRREAYRLCEEAMLANLRLPDAKEGIGAFLEKRHPSWRHSDLEEED